jgi:hypothetical protein
MTQFSFPLRRLQQMQFHADVAIDLDPLVWLTSTLKKSWIVQPYWFGHPSLLFISLTEPSLEVFRSRNWHSLSRKPFSYVFRRHYRV